MIESPKKDGSSVVVVTSSSRRVIEGKSAMTSRGANPDDRVAERPGSESMARSMDAT